MSAANVKKKLLDTNQPLKLIPRQGIGRWLPHDYRTIRSFVQHTLKHVQAQSPMPALIPSVQALRDLVYSDGRLYMLFNEMLKEVPQAYIYDIDPSGGFEIRKIDDLFQTMSYIVQNPISYIWDPKIGNPQIGTPINAILCWPMATKAGLAAFLDPGVNEKLKVILQEWGNYLQDPSRDSNKTVTTGAGGWLNAETTKHSPGLQNFLDTYVVPDINDSVHWGFKTWDQFFTRDFLPGLRPTEPADIVSAAEAQPFQFQKNVQLDDTFWLKGQKYSLVHMLNDEKLARQFEGGTVYQAFLSADDYHCWHAPFDGIVAQDPIIIPGTYYSEPLLNGFSPDNPSEVAPDSGADENSQGYISAVAVRGLLLVDAEDERIGRVTILMIGMAEVSSVDFMGVKKGDRIRKGHKMGMFHFGGSTHCLVFGKHVNLELYPHVKELLPYNSNINQKVPVCSALAKIM